MIKERKKEQEKAWLECRKESKKHQQIIPAWNTLLLLLALWNKQKSHGTRQDRPDTHNFDALTKKKTQNRYSLVNWSPSMFIDKFRKILEKLPIQGQTPVTYMISDQNGST